ncbi:hypothetical protein CF319_g8006 [Tilletia indica]|nr:hypothetical protein CF319_g8006 [Tilletia indica]
MSGFPHQQQPSTMPGSSTSQGDTQSSPPIQSLPQGYPQQVFPQGYPQHIQSFTTEPTGGITLVLQMLGGLQESTSILGERLDGFNMRLGQLEQWQRGQEQANSPSAFHAQAVQTSPLLHRPWPQASQPLHPAFTSQRDQPSPSRFTPFQSATRDLPQNSSSPQRAQLRRSISEIIPPHLQQQAQEQTAHSSPTPSPLPPKARDAFRALAIPDKNTLRRVLDKMGMSVRTFLDQVEEDGDDSEQHLGDDDIVQVSTTARFGDSASPTPGASRPTIPTTSLQGTIPVAATVAPSRPLICKQEIIGEYKGDPSKLEGFISRVRDILRSDDVQPGWEPAVIRALSFAMQDDAAVWHQSLSNEEAARLKTVEGWVEALREAFPTNAQELYEQARTRAWDKKERVGAYYHDKLRLLRQAYGFNQTEEYLVTEIKARLPPSFRSMIRLPKPPTLQDLRRELNDHEYNWKEMYGGAGGATTPARLPHHVQPSSTTSMVRSVSAPTTPGSRAGPTIPPRSTDAAPVSLALTYDPTRITPARNGQPRTYKRPDNDKVMALNRACQRCGGDHFNFEHEHLSAPAPQVRTAIVEEEEYPEAAFEVEGPGEEDSKEDEEDF